MPGDHFSLLRQDAADMAVLVAALKAALAPHGWAEIAQPHRKPYTMTKVIVWRHGKSPEAMVLCLLLCGCRSRHSFCLGLRAPLQPDCGPDVMRVTHV